MNWISFLTLPRMLFPFQLSLFLVSCLTDSQGTGCTLSQEFFSSWGWLTYTCCHQTQHTPSNPANIRKGTCSRKCLQDTNLKSGSRLTSPLRKIFPFLPSLFSLPKEQCSKQNFWDAQFPLYKLTGQKHFSILQCNYKNFGVKQFKKDQSMLKRENRHWIDSPNTYMHG